MFEPLSGVDRIAQLSISGGQVCRSLLNSLFQLIVRMPESFLGPLELGDISDRPEPAGNGALGVVEWLYLNEDMEPFFVAPAKSKLQTTGGSLPGHRLSEGVGHRFAVFRRPINERRPGAHELLLSPSDHVAEASINVTLASL